MHIKIWRWRDAPQAYRDLSEHGGDEDYVMLVPADYGWDHLVDLLGDRHGSAIGCCSVHRHELPCGSTLYIGAHA